MSAARPTYVYVGTYTQRYSHVDGKDEGISVFSLDPRDGALTPTGAVTHVLTPVCILFRWPD